VLAYLSRYTHRVAISNSRLIAADATFRYKSPRHRQCPTHRDFVPWRFLDAGRLSASIGSAFRRPKPCAGADMRRHSSWAGGQPAS
jgi:Putative transposase